MGDLEVKQLHSGILPKIILKGKRSVTVQSNTEFDAPFDKMDFQSPSLQKGISYVENIMYSYFLQS